jgi:hypothetical protein
MRLHPCASGGLSGRYGGWPGACLAALQHTIYVGRSKGTEIASGWAERCV